MQTLKLDKSLFQKIRDKDKQATIRLGMKSIYPGKLIFIAPDESEMLEVIVTSVKYTNIISLTEKDIQLNKYYSISSVFKDLEKYYPDLGLDSTITFIAFRYDGP